MLPLHHGPTSKAYVNVESLSGLPQEFVSRGFRFGKVRVLPVFENVVNGLTIDDIVNMFDGLDRDRLIESLDNQSTEEGVEKAWSDEIKRRIDDIRLGRVEMIPGEEVHRRLLARLSNSKK